ncbi:MAG: LuxR family transcriptional regulator [Hyphomicrobiales bacterium]|nr:LuxR family transcriptional regulator [Hyphomicrobiales bacterium]
MTDLSELEPLPSDSEDVLWDKVHRYAAEQLGITSILFGFTHTRHLTELLALERGFVLRHSHPKDYTDHFGNASFLENDLCAVSLILGVSPFLWHRAHSVVDATPAQKEQALVDHEFGMDVGVSLVFHFAEGRGTAGIGMAARWAAPEDFEAAWSRNGEAVTEWLTRFEPLMRRKMVANRFNLSRRQRQVLAYSAAGFLAKQIAELMSIKEGTVYNYLDLARVSLNSATTLEAVAKAYVYELI